MKKVFLVSFASVCVGCAHAAPEELSLLEYIDTLPPPALMEGVGNSHLEITTDSALAQQYFDQGVSLLHDFWWFEAYRSFLHASQLDPESPMPHWGIYRAASSMANLDKEQRRQVLDDAMAAMQQLRENAGDREQHYLDAALALHAGQQDGGDRDAAIDAHNAKLVALVEKYPDEIEARLFLWGELERGYDTDGTPRVEQLYGQLLLESQFEPHPDHQGLLHYWIHSQESGPRPASALDAAKRLADLAPNAGHIVHMPGHIHYLMGNYDEAHLQFKKAEAADARYMATYDIEPIFTWNYLHNFSFMMGNLAEAGRMEEGAEVASRIADMTESSSFRHLPGFEMLLGRAITERAFMEMRVGNFAEAAALLGDSRWDDWEQSPRLQSLVEAYRTYASGMAAALAGEPDAAERFSRELDSVLFRSMRDEEAGLGYRQPPLEVAALELQGMAASARGNNDEALELLNRAVDMERDIRYAEPRLNIHPAAESLARVYLEEENWDAARAAYESVLKQRANAGMPLFGIARSHELEGNVEKARAAYEAFIEAWASADPQMPQVVHAQAWLAQQ